jgi:hypothetical protein
MDYPVLGNNGTEPPKAPVFNRKHTSDLSVLVLAAALAIGYAWIVGAKEPAAQNMVSGVIGACLMWVKRN